MGIAEIAIATPSSSTWSRSCPRYSPNPTMMATATHAIVPRTLVSESNSFCSGDLLGATAESMVAI